MPGWRSVVAVFGRPGLRKLAAGLFSIAVFVLALAVLHRALGRFDFAHVAAIAAAYPPSPLIAALLLALASYAALGGFDWLGLHHVKRPLPLSWTLLISFVSHAVSHNAGFAVLTGGSVRLRMYSTFGLGVVEVGGVVAFAGLTFGLGVGLVASVAFIAEAGRIAPLLRLPAALISGLGWAGAGLLAAYFLWTALAHRPLTIGRWRLATPSVALALGQVSVAAADLALVAGALYLLLPMAGSGIGYPAFIGLYVVATVAGTLSHVPGGLGVFEGAMALLLPVPAPDLLAALLIFRVIYNLLPLVLAAVVLVVFELVQHRRHAPQTAWLVGLGPALVGILVFAAGVVLLWSGTAAPTRLPPWLAEPAHLMSGTVGGALLILAWGLLRQTRWSHRLALPATAVGAVLALMRGPDWGAAALLGMAVATLAAAGPLFPKSEVEAPPVPAGWWGAAAAVVAGAMWLTWHGDAHALRIFSFSADFGASRAMRANLLALAAVAAAAEGWRQRRQLDR